MGWEKIIETIMVEKGYTVNAVESVISKIRLDSRAMSYLACGVTTGTAVAGTAIVLSRFPANPALRVALLLTAGGYALSAVRACEVVKKDIKEKLLEEIKNF